MLLADEPNIREVIMFPMNQNAEDLMMNAPNTVRPEQLRELHIPDRPSRKKKANVAASTATLAAIRQRTD